MGAMLDTRTSDMEGRSPLHMGRQGASRDPDYRSASLAEFLAAYLW